MADETISTRIVANADFSALIADVHKVTASLSKLQEQLANSNKMLANQIAVMNRSFSDTIRSTGQFSTHFVSLQSDVEKFGKNLDSGKLKLNQYFNTFRDHARTSGGLVRDLAKQQVALQNAILQPLGRNAQGLMQFNVHVPRGLDEVKNKTAIARQELQIMNRVIQDGAGQLINWGKNTQWAGRQLTVGLTVPLAAFGAQAAKAFREADQELVRLTKVYGDVAGTSAAELGKVRDDVVRTSKEISAAMGVSFKETIGLAADIAATGKTGDELLGSIKETTRLAVLGEVDRQEAMKATLAIQSAFKQNTEELSESINFLNAVENQTSTTLNDLVEAIPKAGPVIQGLGGSVQDLALYLTAMREGGINASEGANALKSALASLINPTDVAVGKFKTLGIDLLGIVNNNAGNLTGTLTALQGALDSLDPLQKQQAIEQLFGKFQFSRLNALFENLGRQGSQTLQVMDLMKASSEDLANVAGRELTAVTESASGKYRRALESLKASLAEVGEQFLTINTTLINVIDKVVQFANNLPKPIKQVLALLGGLTAIAGPLIMITGVLANFFGYILKGVGHMKAFFKGGEGWKYLTPEMLAAEKAGKLVEQSFYSDAKAAAVLQQALRNLLDEFAMLEAKAKSGAIAVNPAVSTMAGNLVMNASGQRIVNPQHPLVGPMGTRASSHMVPRGQMTDAQRLQQTMFGMVPGSIDVNRQIGQNPQIYMNEPLPNVPGLTTIKGASTGIVSSEAARWHTMMATLGMQSKAEVDNLKKTIAATGTVSKEFMTQFDDILPHVNMLTNNAAKESGLIVAELRAGKINLDAARAKIVALNLETERLIAATVQAQATAMGRTINPTIVPTLNQPVVDATGKSNMRELFKKGKTRDLINKIAGTLGVRTSGAGYNIETTMPRKMNSGGYVYTMNDGNIVPGPNVDADVVPAMLTPGEFVVNAESTKNNLPLLQAINGQGSSGPMYNDGSSQEIRAKYSGRQLAHLTDTLYASDLNPAQRERIMDLFGLSKEQVSNPSTRVSSSFFAGYHKFFNQGTNNGNLDINKAIMYLEGKPVADPQFAKGIVVHDPMTAYDGMMMDMGIPVGERADFAKTIDKQIVNRLKMEREKGIRFLADSADVSRGQVRAAIIGDAISDAVIKSGNEEAMRGLKSLKQPGEVRIQNPRRGTSDRFFPERTDRASTLLASIVAKRRMPQVSKRVQGMFPGIRSRVFGAAKNLPMLLPAGRAASGPLARLARRNSGGIIGMNSGGMVPAANGQKYNMGGMVQGYNEGGEAQRKGTGGMGMFMGGMGLQMAGGAMGGTAGTVVSSMGMAMQFMPMLGILPKLSASTKIFSGAINLLTKSAKGALVALRAFALANPVLLGITVAVGAVIAGIKLWNKNVQENRKEQTALYGVSEKGAKELGISYVSLTDKMKALREEQQLAKDKARAYFESYTTIGGGLTLTIEKLRELKERIKKDMPETLEVLNKIDSTKVNEWAANLKAQMISSGKSVEDSTNLIYALIEASNKAGMGVSAVSSKLFSGITDQGQAAEYILSNLAKNIQNISNIDPSAFAANLDTALSSLDAAVKSMIGTKDKNGELIDETKALAIQYEKINNSGYKNKQIGEETLAVLQKQRPEFANILNKSDTIGSMIAKWRIHTQNVFLDLKNINSEQAMALAGFYDAMDAAKESALTVEGSTGALKDTAGVIDDLAKREKAARTASENGAKAAEKYNKAKVQALQNELKEVKKLADAKRKALQESLSKENRELELQKAKLELQTAVARGDNEAIAAAQIRIQQLQKEATTEAAMAKVDDQERKEEERINAAIDAENKKRDAKVTAAGGQGVNADRLGASKSLVTAIGQEVANVAALKKAFDAVPSAENQAAYDEAAKNVLRKIAENAGKDPEVFKAFKQFLQKDSNNQYKKDAKGNYVPVASMRTGIPLLPGASLPGPADKLFSDIGSGLESFALKIMGGNKGTLQNIYELLAKVTPKLGSVSIAKDYGDISYNKWNPKTWDNTDNISKLVKDNNLKTGDSFRYQGKEYKVKSTSGGWPTLEEVKMAMGGYVKKYGKGSIGGVVKGPGTPTSDSIPALLSDGEYVLNAAAVSKFGVPMLDQMNAAYNIPTGTFLNNMPATSNSFNNNVYNIDIDLNGTNVSADDIMRRFKAELALVGAKEGRVRTLGGNY